ncbi:hypothetical protein QBC44DRAFT_372626 [Cladorrhinum sp. PSN332]|nr:hypothetical protein QBC44DRAFT_372626 [Cladorrhinum sp. PSN332]
MKFSVATVAAFAALVLARPEFTNTSYQGIKEGEPFTLTWHKGQGTVTIHLVTGEDEGSLNPVRTLTTSTSESGSFTFTPSNLPSGRYTFSISDESGDPTNYGELFTYTGTGAPLTTGTFTSKTASATKTSSSASSTATTETETETETSTSTVTSSASTSRTTTFTTTTSITSSSSTAPASTTAAPPPNSNNGQRFASSLALVLGTVAALVFFN